MIVACRGSSVDVRHVVFQARVEAEWLTRPMPGYCSQHCAVEYVRPPPEMRSSAPARLTTTLAPASPPPLGRGPQGGPHSPMIQRTVSGVADHRPSSVGTGSARAGPARNIVRHKSAEPAHHRTARWLSARPTVEQWRRTSPPGTEPPTEEPTSGPGSLLGKGVLTPAARFATAPPPPSAGSRSQGGLDPRGSLRDRSPAAFGGLALARGS